MTAFLGEEGVWGGGCSFRSVDLRCLIFSLNYDRLQCIADAAIQLGITASQIPHTVFYTFN